MLMPLKCDVINVPVDVMARDANTFVHIVYLMCKSVHANKCIKVMNTVIENE